MNKKGDVIINSFFAFVYPSKNFVFPFQIYSDLPIMPPHPSLLPSISDSIINWNSSVRSWLHTLEICAFKDTTVAKLPGARRI